MSWFILMNIFSVLLAFIQIGRLSDHKKDLEILILRQQLNPLAYRLRVISKSVHPVYTAPTWLINTVDPSR